MIPRERVLCALRGGTPEGIPFVEQFVGGTIGQQLLGLPLHAEVKPGELATAMGNDAVKFSRYPPLFYERVPLPEGGEGIGPGLIRTRHDLPKLQLPTDEEWISRAREFLRTQRGQRAAFGGTRLGLSATLISMGLDNFSIALHEDRGLVEEVLDRYVRFARRTVHIFCELGFDGIWVFDDFAFKTGPMFSPTVLRNLVLPRLRTATAQITIPWIFHSDGNLFPVLDDLLTLGMSGIHPIEPEAMDLGEAKRVLQGRACVIGNISVNLLASGTPEQIREAVKEAWRIGAPGGGYMLSTGNCIPHYARIENVRALVEAVAALRKGPA